MKLRALFYHRNDKIRQTWRKEGGIMQELLTVSEVAQLMKVTPQTVLRWIYTKRLKAYKAGGQWRIRPEDLQYFIAADTTGAVVEGELNDLQHPILSKIQYLL
ncbi:MAG: helix-turn-helix domain-containing protein [Tepidanaerobacteraceae bacterium]